MKTVFKDKVVHAAGHQVGWLKCFLGELTERQYTLMVSNKLLFRVVVFRFVIYSNLFSLFVEQRTTVQGQVYFLHTQTGVSTWHDPRIPRYVFIVANSSLGGNCVCVYRSKLNLKEQKICKMDYLNLKGEARAEE